MKNHSIIHKFPMVLAVLAVVAAAVVPLASCRRHQPVGHHADAHYCQLDSMLSKVGDCDSLAARVEQYRKAGDKVGEMLACKHYGRHLRWKSKFQESLEVIDRSLLIASDLHDTIEIIDALNQTGTVYRRLGDLSKGLNYHFQALKLCDLYSDHNSDESIKNRVVTLNGIGNIELSLKNYTVADSVLRMAFQGERQLHSDVGMAINYANLGSIKRALGQPDSALVYYRNSMELNQRAGNQLGVALCHQYFGELHESEHRYSHAQNEYEQAYEAMRGGGDTWHWLESCLALARVSALLGEHEQALRYVDEAEAEALRIGSKEHLSAVNQMKYEYARDRGDDKAALQYYVRSQELLDSITGAGQDEDMNSQRVGYERLRNDEEVGVLNRDIAHLKRMRNTIALLALLLLVMAGAIIAALAYAVRTRTHTQRIMRQIEETRSLFFTNVVHQLRTPLTAIMGATDGILGNVGDKSSLHRNVDIIERQGNRLLSLVDHILVVGSVRSAIKDPDWHAGDAVAYLRMLVESYREQCVGRQIELTYVSREQSAEIDIVPNYLNKIVGSLIENAIAYSNDFCKITVTSRIEDDMLVIRVADNGIGISQADMPHVFEPFFRGAAAEQVCEGVGIGLTVVRDMAMALGGSVAVDSTLGKGSVFTVSLPCRNPHLGVKKRLEMVVAPVRQVVRKSHPVTESNAVGQDASAKPVVLVVEDNSDVAHLIGDAFGRDYAVYYALDGEQGLIMANELLPDLVVTDVKMPIMDGLELCRRIRASLRLCRIPIIVLSARHSRDDRIRGVEAGADVYMVKPFSSEEVRAWAARLLAQRALLAKTNDAGYQLVAAAAQRTPVTTESIEDQVFLTELAHRIDEQLSKRGANKLDIDKIALSFRMGESQLRRRVQQLTGKSMTAWITHLRMEKALGLLRQHPDMLVGEVAERCGFADVAYFSRVFRQHYDMTPTQARQRGGDESSTVNG